MHPDYLEKDSFNAQVYDVAVEDAARRSAQSLGASQQHHPVQARGHAAGVLVESSGAYNKIDGLFKGDRPMTRYEMAMVVASNSKIRAGSGINTTDTGPFNLCNKTGSRNNQQTFR